MKFEVDARFALGPSALHLASCGPETAAGTLFDALIKQNDTGLRELLEKYPNLDAFQKTLGEIVGKDPYDEEIQEAYWIGNELLQRANDRAGYTKLLDNYRQHQAFEGFIHELEKKTPKKLILNHNFQVSWIGVVDAGGLDTSLPAVNQCLIKGGEVKTIRAGSVEIDTFGLVRGIGGYKLRKEKQYPHWDNQLDGSLEVGDRVAIHWNWVAMKINKEQMDQLHYWSEEVAKIL